MSGDKTRLTDRSSVSAAEIILVISVFIICIIGAVFLPIPPCPDERARRLLTDWMFNTGTLPTGNELETVIMPHGFSYALRPFLSAIIGVVFMKLTSLFTDSETALIVASRMCSVLSVTVCSVFCLKIGKRLFKNRSSALVLAASVCFLPQVLFLGMYQNNDSLSLAAVCITVCFFARGSGDHWSWGSTAGFAFGLGLALMSYYTIYGWVLAGALFFTFSVFKDKEIPRKVSFFAKRAAMIGGICFAFAGWFFIRNAFLHHGDFLGIAAEKDMREYLRAHGVRLYDYVIPKAQGKTLIGMLTEDKAYFIKLTLFSFIAVFGMMDILVPKMLYKVYIIIAFFGAVLFVIFALLRGLDSIHKQVLLFMTVSVAINISLHVIHSYTRDYQPQGRYIISMALLMGYVFAYSSDQLQTLSEDKLTFIKSRSFFRIVQPQYAFIFIWLVLCACALTSLQYMI